MRLIPKEAETLWTLFTGPTIWALHFLACYATAAVLCAKADASPDAFQVMRLTLGAVTLVALGAIILSAWLAWRQWGFGAGDPPHDAPTREDRLFFQGLATLLLSGLSFVAIVFGAMPLLFLDACQP